MRASVSRPRGQAHPPMGRQAPEGLLGIHLNLLATALGIVDQLPAKSAQERAAHDALATFRTSGFGYFLEQSTRPQTIGYSLLDSTAPAPRFLRARSIRGGGRA